MTVPALAAERFLRCLAVGLALGCCYGALRPLRHRATALADGIFGVLLLWGWVFCGFGICGGDLRLGMTLAMLLGIWAWDATAGRLLGPVFDKIWSIFCLFWHIPQLSDGKGIR